jgi:sugar phosphate isomerase/epimerase
MRKIVSYLLSFACVLSMGGACDNTNEPAGNKLRIATTTSDFGVNCETDEERIYELYQAGFRNIDLSMYSFEEDSVYVQDNWQDTVENLKAQAVELGMQFVQAHSQGGNPLSEEESEAEWILTTTLRQIEICEILDIENIVVHAGYLGNATKEEWFKANKDFYEKLLPTAERCGVNVLCENSTKVNMGDRYYINTGKDMREFIKYVNHPNFHGCWDTGHANCEEGGQYDDIMELGEEMYAIHFAENDGASDGHLLMYCGTLDNDEVMRALRDVGFKGYFTLECDARKRVSNWKGPELPIMKEVGTLIGRYTRQQQERLLYESAVHLLSSYDMLMEN